MVVGAEDLAQHEVREGEYIQRDRDEIRDIAAESALEQGRHIEDDERQRTLDDVVDGDVQPVFV